MIERHFLGWDAAVTAKVRDFLLPPETTGPVDLSKDLVVVPTHQAGRRLRESMALHCAERRTALLSLRVVTSEFFLRPQDGAAKLASPMEAAAVWADVLMKADISKYGGLFPARVLDQGFTWAMKTGEMIQRLRDTLADGGYRIADVYSQFGGVLEELDRWHEMAELESAYLERLSSLGWQDPCDFMIKQAEKPEPPRGVQRIVVAAVPDPTPLMIRALARLAEQIPVAILVHAPESLADQFDSWGRPIAERWREAHIDIPDSDANVILAGSPASQSRRVLELMVGEMECFGPGDIALGVPDGSVVPSLEAELADKGLHTFDPAGSAVREHLLYQILETYQPLVRDGSYRAFSAFLRHADVLGMLEDRHSLSARWVLEELDNFQNRHLPESFEDVVACLARRPADREESEFSNLRKAVEVVRDQVSSFRSNDVESVVRSLLQTVYDSRNINPNDLEDEEFIAVAKSVDAALRELADGIIGQLGIEKSHALELLLHRLGGQRYYREHAKADVDLEGWLELPWNDAPFLIVTGMNEGSVPDSRLSDIFLPDSLRVQLKLRHDADRLATDAYVMTGLIESRRAKGRVCFVAGKTGGAGEPLKPSRLLFRCNDGELPNRAEQLFGDPVEKLDNHPSTISFLLQPGPPADLPSNQLDLVQMRVTWFKDYLTCPFRFYLRRVLGMEELDDEKEEMDDRDFGSLVHHALERMAHNDEICRCEKEGPLRDFLRAEAERWVTKRFGPSPPLQVMIQLDAAKQRLDAAARVQARLVRDGWELIRHEKDVEAELKGMKVRGRIDRIDRHQPTGRLRLLDYKTSDTAKRPEDEHIGFAAVEARDYARVVIEEAERRWVDLQLPLYRVLLAHIEGFEGPIELGYFNLPREARATDVVPWRGFDDRLLESAKACAEGVIEDIRNRRFWPPSVRVDYDDFERLFHADISQCVNVAAIENLMKGRKL